MEEDRQPASTWPGEPPIAPPTGGWVLPQPQARSRFRSARLRSRVAIAALIVLGFIDLVEIVHLASFPGLIESYQLGDVDLDTVAAFDTFTSNIALLYLVAYVACGVTFVAWLSRAVDNAPALGAGEPPRGPRAAIGWWFVPFASLVVPFTIVTDLHDRLATAIDGGRARPLLIGWWLGFLAQNVGGYLSLILGSRETLEDLQASFNVTTVVDLVQIAAAALAIAVVYRIQAREDTRATQLASQHELSPTTPPDAGR